MQEFHFTNKTFGLVVANARVWTEIFSFLDHLLYGTCKIFYPVLLFRFSQQLLIIIFRVVTGHIDYTLCGTFRGQKTNETEAGGEKKKLGKGEEMI